MQQSSATQSLHLSFWGLRKIVAYSHSSSQCLLVSTVFGTVSSLHPTSFLMIFILVYIPRLLITCSYYTYSTFMLVRLLSVAMNAVRCLSSDSSSTLSRQFPDTFSSNRDGCMGIVQLLMFSTPLTNSVGKNPDVYMYIVEPLRKGHP